jgi:uncharacterized protein YkwD
VSLDTLDLSVLVELNAVRKSHGLVPLKANLALTVAARDHSSDGSPFWKRLTAYSDAGQGTWAVGENLLWSSPDVSGAQALRLWMASPEHRHNILTAKWREIGISAIHADSAPGTYGNRAVTVITTDFGVRG